jgi:thymidylate synthase (FAD)
MSAVFLISLSSGAGKLEGKSAQEVITYTARVSNPANQENFDTAAGLLRYCIRENHWSVFEQADMTLEINTTRGIAAQVLRHRSFTFQEFSQRYADTKLLAEGAVIPELRRQDTKNRQNSIDDISECAKQELQAEIAEYFVKGQQLYNRLLDEGVAKECARFVLPLATPTRIYMKGSCRSWIHYIDLRTSSGTQKEHKDIAEACKDVFKNCFPDVAIALGWKEDV